MEHTIYVQLLNEGTYVWRPVKAVQKSADTYQIIDEVPEEEEWEFLPGTIVKVETKLLAKSAEKHPHLVAVKEV